MRVAGFVDRLVRKKNVEQVAIEGAGCLYRGELAERIARDSTTLGNLITRHLGEFDRTVKTYGGEMVERLGERTQEVVTAMRDHLDNFDTRVNTKSLEITTSLDQQFSRFRVDLDELATVGLYPRGVFAAWKLPLFRVERERVRTKVVKPEKTLELLSHVFGLCRERLRRFSLA